MRPHANGYCAQENGLLTAHKTLRQQIAGNSFCNNSGYQAYHAATNTNKWFCYNGPQQIPPQPQPPPPQQPQPPTLAKPPMHYSTVANNFQVLPHATHLPTLQQAQHHLQQKHHHQQQQVHQHLQRLRQYPSPGGVGGGVGFVPTNETHNYAKLSLHAVNQQRINECAGIPLISNATTHLAPTQRQRVMRKIAQSPTHIMLPPAQQPHQHQHHPLQQHAAPHAPLIPATYATWNLPPTNVNCLPQRALRTQTNLCNNNNQHNWPAMAATTFENSYVYANYNINAENLKQCGKLEKSRLLRYQNSAPAVLSSQELSVMTKNEEATSNSNETKVLTETCLPRIIKPRKRRKKERKPTATNGITSTGAVIRLDTKKQIPISADVSLNTKLYKSNEHLYKPCLINTLEQWQKHENYLTSDYAVPANKTLWSEVEDERLRSIWDYPLRRSSSDSEKSSASSTASSASSSSASSSYSLSSCSADSYFSGDMNTSPNCTPSRADIVGVIGSNRTQNTNAELQHTVGNGACTNVDVNVNVPRKPLLSACLSDSNDSGYGDILTGINIVNDLFNHATTKETKHTKIITQSANVQNFVENSMSFMHETDADAAATLLLLPETAETLLNESINEISRKLIETCGNEMSNDFLEVPHSACFSTCSDFSNDSGVEINNLHNNKRNNSSTNNLINCDELIFNFDNLHMNEAQQKEEVQQYHTLSKLASTMENFLMHLNTNNNSNYNTHTTDENNNDCYTSINIKNTNSNTTEQKHNQQFVKNCLNLVWPNGNEEVREPPITAMLNSLLEVNKTAFSSAASAL